MRTTASEVSSRFPCTSLNLERSRRNPAFSERYVAMKTIAANPTPMINVRVQLSGLFNPMSANFSPRNKTSPHPTPTSRIFPIASSTKAGFPADRLVHKGTKNGVEGKRHHHEREDVDQITPPSRSATSFGRLNVAFCHSLEIIISAQNRNTNFISAVPTGMQPMGQSLNARQRHRDRSPSSRTFEKSRRGAKLGRTLPSRNRPTPICNRKSQI